MRQRGACYKKWRDGRMHSHIHTEQLSDSTMIDVQTRLSPIGATQMFIGIYSPSGVILIEVSYENRPGESMVRAMAWGVEQARRLAVGAC